MPHSEAYTAYINSPLWRARRRRALEIAGNRCQFEILQPGSTSLVRCPSSALLSVHHKTYERLGQELDEDLEVLCWFHHQLEHLMWVRCKTCDGTLFVTDAEGSAWLESELRSLGVDLMQKGWTWPTLPSKDDLVTAATALRTSCSNCDHWRDTHG